MCAIESPAPIWDARPCDEGIWEVPVSVFRNFPRHFRSCQLSACSSSELIHAVEEATTARWSTMVVVSHSFELLANRRSLRRTVPRWTVVKRFEALCRFMASAARTSPTAHFADLDPSGARAVAPISGTLLNTASRMVEQMTTRVVARFTGA
jgi:hypothetical protein